MYFSLLEWVYISQFHLEIESWETNFDDNIFISRSISVSRPVNWEHFGPRPGLRSETKTLWGYEYSERARRVLSSYGPLFLPGPWIPDTIRRYSLSLHFRPLSDLTMQWYWKTSSLLYSRPSKNACCTFNGLLYGKQALRNSCELLRQRKELHASLCNCMQAYVTVCKLM